MKGAYSEGQMFELAVHKMVYNLAAGMLNGIWKDKQQISAHIWGMCTHKLGIIYVPVHRYPGWSHIGLEAK